MAKLPLADMETTLDALVDNAKALKIISQGKVTVEELSALQGKQEELIAQLVKHDKSVQKLGDAVKKETAWNRIQDKLQDFSKYNEEFIGNLAVRKGLIQFEIQEVKQARQSVNDMKSRYGHKPGDERNRVNTSM